MERIVGPDVHCFWVDYVGFLLKLPYSETCANAHRLLVQVNSWIWILMSVCVLVYFKDYYDIDSNQFLFLREASYPLKPLNLDPIGEPLWPNS